LHIAVSRKKISDCHDDSKRDFVYVRGPVENTGCIPLVPFVKRSSSKTGALDSQTRRKKMRLVMELGADEKTRLQFVANSDIPIRQYFHSRSNEPMLPGEWDIDSDDEEDERWLTKMSDEVSAIIELDFLKAYLHLNNFFS
jgi:VEFS-Box of polycomb protein